MFHCLPRVWSGAGRSAFAGARRLVFWPWPPELGSCGNAFLVHGQCFCNATWSGYAEPRVGPVRRIMRVQQEPAGWSPPATLRGGRKVRAPKDTVMGNAHRPQGQGKCNRKDTAPPPAISPMGPIGPIGRMGHIRLMGLIAGCGVRVKWRGKSPPAAGQPAGSANPTGSKAKYGRRTGSGPLPTPG
jgi:hypothetical protein